jgi:uncharacterized membrane protein YdjX (TVP38/TMEM64 family)
LSRLGTLKRLLPLVVIVALVVAFFVFGLNRYLTLQALHDNDDALRAFVIRHPLLARAAFVAVYALVVALSVPGGAVMTVAGGLLFGLWMGAAFAIVGATVGAVILFLIARFVVGDALRARAGPFLKRMAEGFERNAFAYLLFLRLVPAFPFWTVNLVPALIGVRLRSFAAATLIGIIPYMRVRLSTVFQLAALRAWVGAVT